ncbi:putative serine/threonine-protein kinase [Capsicum annuum]|uniref:Serine/threonine-protein kinase n=1 Tax=Capsicum annuum TaxID=4072 RepID=A0A2G3A239_CAPAN|nr:protein IMPAIRED IN BABA-INDUCED STERILITY 1 isoform X1 [Capsicum annuum]KAF3682741.1 putative serine/threonine-protein kinase [Capsicum annuum]PHT88294.1 putative serine/threonine-protein kinase [Capsicum annuum]
MGCVASKQTVSVTPAFDHSGVLVRDGEDVGSGRSRVGSGGFGLDFDLKKVKKRGDSGLSGGSEMSESGRVSSNGCGSESVSFRLGNLQKYVEGEQVAAGWPAWLSAVAGEAIQGWVPLRAESFEKLEKIGQGTYSSVFRARDLESGRTVALKKVRFDNFEPESVRFMAREIMILRRLDHPNIIKLEGLITSRLSCSMYLVFEYMEHDISGLLSCPEVEFSESQIKCYMKQLLSGIEHCHSRGVMHRDIKGANLLVNNDGILKVADFGLANFCNLGRKQPLTSRVVTLWYRPPELLLGSTEYGASVDLWSVGCVFGELLTGKPILQGRTEVEQLHKIFKLCGSPPDDYWKKSKLPHATLFKPQHPYESCLWDTFTDLAKSAVSLIETLLSVEPPKRGTASSGLVSEYFKTKPHACDPASLPKYPPSKEIDAKHCEEAKRKKPGGRARGPETTRKSIRKPTATNKLAPEEKLPIQNQGVPTNNGSSMGTQKGDIIIGLERAKPSVDSKVEASHIKNASQGDVPFSGPLQVSGSSGFAWARRRTDDSSMRSRSKSSSRSLKFEPSGGLHIKNNMELKRRENYETTNGSRTNSKGRDTYESTKGRDAMQPHWSQLEQAESFDASDGYHSQELSLALYLKEETAFKRINVVQDQMDKVEFSGPLLSQSHRVEELLEKHERQIRQAVRRSWFQRVRRNGN